MANLPSLQLIAPLPQLSGEIQDACCDYADVEQTNNDLYGALRDIVATPYFRYHKVSYSA